MISRRLVSRGDILISNDGVRPILSVTYPDCRPLMYAGGNRWVMPTGKLVKSQDMHRRLLSEIKLGWWRIVR